MFMPPIERDIPPFNRTQIRDARNDKRGLVTTFDLFNLYFNIERGIVSKDDAREALFQVGLVSFRPSGATTIPRPREIHYKGEVVVIDLDDLEIKTGDRVVFDSNGRHDCADVLEIQVNGEAVERVSRGEVGVRLSKGIDVRKGLWLMGDKGTETGTETH